MCAKIQSSITSNSQNLRTIQTFTNWWRDKVQYTQTMQYYCAIRRNKLLIHTTTWMNIKNRILSERHQTQKTITELYDYIIIWLYIIWIIYHMIIWLYIIWFHLFKKFSRKSKTIEAESRIVTAWDWEWEEGVKQKKKTQRKTWSNRSLLKLYCGDDCTTA